MTRVRFSSEGRTWEATLARIDAGELAAACSGVPVHSFEAEADCRKGELIGVDGKTIGSWRVVS